jgi:hypothetical protein
MMIMGAVIVAMSAMVVSGGLGMGRVPVLGHWNRISLSNVIGGWGY